MNNLNRLYEMYKDRVCVGEKSFSEINEHIQSMGVTEIISIHDLHSSVIGNLIYNIKCAKQGKANISKHNDNDLINHLKNPEIYMKNGEFNFAIYKFPFTNENAEFYKNYSFTENDIYKFIYVIFEVNTNTIFSNCSKLQLELCVYKGVSAYDVQHRTMAFFEYLFCLEAMDNRWY